MDSLLELFCDAPVHPWAHNIFGKLMDDMGYISPPLFEELLNNLNIEFITGIIAKALYHRNHH
jgi:hypothetical protein